MVDDENVFCPVWKRPVIFLSSFFFLVQKCPVYNQFINPATLTLQSKILSLLLYRQYGDARLGDVDDDCILGCVAKTVCAENEQLIFFNTVNLSDQDLKITEVGHLKLSVSWKQVEQSSDNRCVLANCARICLWIVFQMAYFLIPDATLFELGPFLGNSTRVWRTDGRTDGRTHPLIEMRELV